MSHCRAARAPQARGRLNKGERYADREFFIDRGDLTSLGALVYSPLARCSPAKMKKSDRCSRQRSQECAPV